MSKPVAAIMQKEMTRQEFLMTLGFGIATILGFSNLIRLLTGKSAESHIHARSSLGYGSSPYGGGKE
jgi:Trp operon repressor